MTSPNMPLALATLTEKLHFSFDGPEVIGGFDTFRVDLSDWKLVLSDENPCIWVKAGDIHHLSPTQLVDSLLDIVRQKGWQNETVLVFLDGEMPNLAGIIPHYLPTFVLLNQQDQLSIHQSASPTVQMLNILLHQLPRSQLAPYEKHKPVVAGQFFGREAEINKILIHPSTNFLIIGIRRIGKTSLLKEVQRRMDDSDVPEKGQIRRLYVDCTVFETEEDFLRFVTSQLDPSELKMLLSRAAQGLRYRSLMFDRYYALHGGRVTLLIDELDRLLTKLKDPNSFFDILRHAWNSGKTRYILAGFRRPMNEVFSEKSPLYNMVEKVSLSRLPYKDVYKMVTVPMERLKISIKNREGVVNRIFQETAGLPNYIQFYCSTLLEQIDVKGGSLITEEDLASVYENREFRDFILETFMSNTEVLEQALVYTLILEGEDPLNKRTFSLRAIDGFLKKRKLNLRLEQLEQVCRNLEVAGVLNPVGQNYDFAVPLLATTIRAAREVEFLYDKVREEILAEKLVL